MSPGLKSQAEKSSPGGLMLHEVSLKKTTSLRVALLCSMTSGTNMGSEYNTLCDFRESD